MFFSGSEMINDDYEWKITRVNNKQRSQISRKYYDDKNGNKINRFWFIWNSEYTSRALVAIIFNYYDWTVAFSFLRKLTNSWISYA